MHSTVIFYTVHCTVLPTILITIVLYCICCMQYCNTTLHCIYIYNMYLNKQSIMTIMGHQWTRLENLFRAGEKSPAHFGCL